MPLLFGYGLLWLGTLWVPAVIGLGSAAVLAVLWFALQWFAPKVGAIVRASTKEARHQPLFWVEMGLGIFIMMLMGLLPFFTFGEDVKSLKSAGLEIMVVMGTILAVWLASTSIADELEGRTALTLLSKPVSRRQFVVGKFLGVLFPTAIWLVIVGMFYLASVSFKTAFDAVPAGIRDNTAEVCRQEMWQVAPALLLAMLQVTVLASVSVAISTRLPMVPNLVLCGTIYALGRLVSLVVQSSAGKLESVAFVGRLLATVLPVLDHFSVQGAIVGGRPISLEYVGWAAIYAAVYCLAAMVTALLLFEDRDLA